MNALYPLKFQTIFKEKLWGGDRLNSVLGMDFSPLPNCGEAWVVSGVPGFQSLVSNGFLEGNELNELVEVYMGDLVGERIYETYGDEFPVLIKFIDAREWLSIQVHPDDSLAHKRGLKGGKTEMWYIIDADEKSELICGFKHKTDKETYLGQLKSGKLPELMRYEPVAAGDVFYMPAGSVHALGPGILLAEIQQTSDITYRIYDWERKDADGNPRELHTEAAMDAINFEASRDGRISYSKINNNSNPIVSTPYFVTTWLNINQTTIKDYSFLDSFVILICIHGQSIVEFDSDKIEFRPGEAILIPACIDEIRIFPDKECTFLEVFMDENLLPDNLVSNN
ncbi:MAG: mannose-6-phosphate isomerase [Bacteroidales bacterium]|nr:mannose-6-phosphate isomerase [Bacteroidales bacterium]